MDTHRQSEKMKKHFREIEVLKKKVSNIFIRPNQIWVEDMTQKESLYNDKGVNSSKR